MIAQDDLGQVQAIEARVELANIARTDLEFVTPVAQIAGELVRVTAAKAGMEVQ
jgi:hypothetical protein